MAVLRKEVKCDGRGVDAPARRTQEFVAPMPPNPNITPLQRFFAKVQITDYCWLWTGTANPRYGTIRVNKITHYCHRWIYEQVVGPIPTGYDIDHLCRYTLCVNPDHLEAVTHGENIRRGANVRAFCPKGHPYAGDNVGYHKRGGRWCRACDRARQLRKPVRP